MKHKTYEPLCSTYILSRTILFITKQGLLLNVYTQYCSLKQHDRYEECLDHSTILKENKFYSPQCVYSVVENDTQGVLNDTGRTIVGNVIQLGNTYCEI